MVGGYMNRFAWVNLTEETVKMSEFDEKDLRKFIGGKGIGTNIIWDHLKELDKQGVVLDKMSAFAPENTIIFAVGPGTGVKGFPSSGRYHVMATKSPLTGSIASANSGGEWGTCLKKAGFDGIIIQGKASQPVYLTAFNGNLQIRKATNLWGKSTFDTDDILHERHKTDEYKISVACIGPAGENLSLLGAIINDKHRAAGRTGIGAILGSKNLKAIVTGGTQHIPMVNPDKFKEISRESYKKLKENAVTGQGLPKYGTAVLVNVLNSLGSLPFNNWQTGYNEDADKISGETLERDFLIKNAACADCSIACGRLSRVKDGAYALDYTEGPEYESIWALGNSCGVTDMPAIIKANHLCNEFGLDTISMGSTIACAMELSEKGFIPREDLQGLNLKFGDGASMVEMVWRTAYQTGIGKYLALGAKKLATHYEHPEFSMDAKGLEMPAYDPRGIKGIGLNFATSNRGGCHVTGYTISPEVLGLPQQIDRLSYEGKANWVKIFQDFTSVVNSTVNCLFATFALGVDDYAALLSAITGWDLTPDEILSTGDRIYTLERMIMTEIGMRNQDTLPDRILHEPMPSGPSKGEIEELDKMLPEYYKLRGWTKEGIPTQEKIKELKLESFREMSMNM